MCQMVGHSFWVCNLVKSYGPRQQMFFSLCIVLNSGLKGQTWFACANFACKSCSLKSGYANFC